ncbi:hypothetical protein GOP47_0007000 [Adiantum capillus-veneris]|uniref:Uncharacterized protein n=1 Tax=Adiantum capillus-veneris TaxID=13818 RepID=A0A9D4UZU2_ADICA|nr:hypothetical protein GOP47_0007000 [Adiantum capillus-veneris]
MEDAIRNHVHVVAVESKAEGREGDQAKTEEALKVKDVKDPHWRWPTHQKWYSCMEGVWTAKDTTSSDEGENLQDGLQCPFELRSPYLIAMLLKYLPEVAKSLYSCAEHISTPGGWAVTHTPSTGASADVATPFCVTVAAPATRKIMPVISQPASQQTNFLERPYVLKLSDEPNIDAKDLFGIRNSLQDELKVTQDPSSKARPQGDGSNSVCKDEVAMLGSNECAAEGKYEVAQHGSNVANGVVDGEDEALANIHLSTCFVF